ncbi:DUF2220 family protein [Agrobacterium salinitolerans]|nr:DUF2220 family protein [Agrobacterium salinitolerans]
MTDVIDRLVRRIETSPDAVRVGERIDWTAFQSAKEVEALKGRLARLIACGALKASYGKAGFKNTIERVTVLDQATLYSALGRRPHAEAARAAASILSEGAEDWESVVIGHIEGLWTRHAKWCGFSIDDAERLLPLQKVSRAIRNGLHEGHDMRTFSTRKGGDSKLIEKNDSAILSYVYHGAERPEGTLREILARSGSVKITSPILVSGSFSVGGVSVGQALSYCGVPVHQLADISLDRVPDYVLTVENLVSFHRHAVEVNDDGRGLVLFTSGQASIAFKEFYGRLVSQLESVPFFHWSDIDEGGLEITRTIMSINPTVRPHLMDLSIVKDHGARATAPVTDDGRFAGSWMEDIAAYLAVPGNLSLEQEMIDPALPDLGQ